MNRSSAFNSGGTFSYTTRSSFLHQISSGDETAWTEFYRRYSGMITRIGQKRQLSIEECDDLMVDVMVIFWKKIDEYLSLPERGRFRNYLTNLTNQAANRIFKRQQKNLTVPIGDMDLEYPEDVDASYMEEWQQFMLNYAMEELQKCVDTESYQVFYMSVVQKRSTAEISAITRKTPNNIYVIRSRCLKKLKNFIALCRQRGESELAGSSHKNKSEN